MHDYLEKQKMADDGEQAQLGKWPAPMTKRDKELSPLPSLMWQAG